MVDFVEQLVPHVNSICLTALGIALNRTGCYIELMIHTPYDKWYAAFEKLVKEGKRGIQRRLSESTGKTPKYINDVFKRRRNASQDLQDQLARALDHTYEEMLKIGAELLGEEKEPFQNYKEIMKLPILERAWAILRQAAEVHEVTGYLSAVGGSKKPKFAQKYLDGEQTEVELYEESLERFAEVVRKIEQAMKEQGIE